MPKRRRGCQHGTVKRLNNHATTRSQSRRWRSSGPNTQSYSTNLVKRSGIVGLVARYKTMRCSSNECIRKLIFRHCALLAMMQPLQVLLWTILCDLVWGYHVFTSPDQLDSKKVYDYIIVGGGTAGSVLAARLSEDARNQILVVEAGGRVEDVLAVHIPFLAPTLPGSQVDWNFTTIPQTGFGNRTINIARGFVLGGSSCINQMAYFRPSNGAWDHWADLVDDPSLSWEAVQKYWLRTSRLVDPVDGHDTTGQVIPSAHGFGPVNVSLFSYTKPVYQSIIETSKKAMDSKFQFNQDNNAGSNLGWGGFNSHSRSILY